MKNLKIKYKLFALLAFVLAMMIFMGCYSLILLSRLNNGMMQVSGNWLPCVIFAEEINTASSDFRIAEYAHVVSQSADDMEMFEADLAEENKEIQDIFADYEANYVVSEEDEAVLNKAKTKWEEYLVVHEQMIEFSSQNETELAMEILNNESQILFDEASATFTELVQFNKNGADAANTEGGRVYSNALIIMVAIMAGSVVLALVAALYIISMIMKPVTQVEKAAKQIITGQLETDITYKSKDELGSLAQNMALLCSMIKGMIDDIDLRLSGIATGDFTVQSTDASMYIGDFGSLNVNMDKISEQLSETLLEIDNASAQVSIGSDQISMASQSLAQGTIRQSGSIEQLLLSLRNVSEGAIVNAKNAAIARDESEKSNEKATESSKQMEKMISSMEKIKEKSDKISNIIKAIDDISFQTNILSLNAAVEAARAGSAGKGFSVVAEEVRNLAIKSAESATDTTQLIDETIATIKEGTDIVYETAKVIDEVIKAANSITELVEKIAIDSEQQQNSVQEVTDEVSEIANIVNDSAATSEQTAASSEELSSQATLLKTLVNKFVLLTKDYEHDFGSSEQETEQTEYDEQQEYNF